MINRLQLIADITFCVLRRGLHVCGLFVQSRSLRSTHVAPPTLGGSVGPGHMTPFSTSLLVETNVGLCLSNGSLGLSRSCLYNEKESLLKDKLSQQERSNSSWVRRRRRRSCDEEEGWGGH